MTYFGSESNFIRRIAFRINKSSNVPYDYEKETPILDEYDRDVSATPEKKFPHPSEIDDRVVDCGLSFRDRLTISRNIIKERIDSSYIDLDYEQVKWLTFSTLGAVAVGVSVLNLDWPS